MTIQMNIAEAKAKLSELIARAEAGEEVIIARHGRPIVALTPKTPPQSGRRRLGIWEHLNLSIPLSAFEADADTEAWTEKSVFPDE